MRKREEFSEWYDEAIQNADICDKRYPIKGMNVWTPYGWKIMTLMDSFIRDELNRTNHDEVHFPVLIPEEEFAKEAQHIRGFEEGVYWVTHAGLNPLDVRLLLRPTSETAMYPMFSLWVRSHADLPLKTYQIVEVYRYETKQTRTLIRVREIHFFESHTCHATFEEAEEQIREDLEIMDNLAKTFCIPYLKMKRPDWDKFAGAHYSVGVDSLMPTGRTMQNGGIHQYRDNFSRAYDIKYEDEKGEHQYVHQTTFGLSERLLGGIVALHGDDRGIVLPPEVAPIQVIIIPIPEKGAQEEILAGARDIGLQLAGCGIRSKTDDRDIRPGAKFYEWERKGVPLRLEFGRNEMKDGAVTLVRRHDMKKETASRTEMVDVVQRSLNEIQKDLWERASEELAQGIRTIENLGDARTGINRVGWCGEESCGHEMEDVTGMSVLGTLYDGEEFKGKCIVCGNPTRTAAYLARTY
ncbi:MAG: proline--tRNA ligase [Thermoplasmata archaeon]